jgi:hypothetical protein
MSRRAKIIIVLAFELCLVAAMAVSFAYFVRDSRDFLADRPPGAQVNHAAPTEAESPT